MHSMVEDELELELVLSPEHSIPISALLRYGTDDPYAVHITFHIGTTQQVHWAFARELLVEGVLRPCGHGDVRVWPATAANQRTVVLMALTSPDGDALLQAPAAGLRSWLERTLRAVPPGTEADLLDIDGGLAGLLAPTDTGDDLRPVESGPAEETGDGESAPGR